MARAGLREEMHGAHAGLTFDVLSAGDTGDTPNDRFEAWKDRNKAQVIRAEQTLEDIISSDTHDLATLSVALRVIRTLLRSGSLA
jgi:glutamate dehydrogenase